MTDTQSILDKIWPGWTIDETLGKGSYGTVYRILRRDEFGHQFTAALKVVKIPADDQEFQLVLNEGMDEDSAKEFFQSVVEDVAEEIVLMSKLKGYTSIVSYEDHAIKKSDDGIYWTIYIRMELLTPLYVYMKEHPLTILDVIRLGIEMCNALELCQRYNIIHRDIKPENILVTDFGQFKLGDFGIARRLDKTSTGLSKKGTYSYMAPEVYRGESYNSTVDIYSLGMVLYRLLNINRGPFLPPFPDKVYISDRETANLRRMNGEPMPYPMKANGQLGDIILKACSYEPDKRYESASAMREALQSIVNDKETYDESYLSRSILGAQLGKENEDLSGSFIQDIMTYDIDPLLYCDTDYSPELFTETEKASDEFLNTSENLKKKPVRDIETRKEAINGNSPSFKDNNQKAKKKWRNIIIAVLMVSVFTGIVLGHLLSDSFKDNDEEFSQETTANKLSDTATTHSDAEKSSTPPPETTSPEEQTSPEKYPGLSPIDESLLKSMPAKIITEDIMTDKRLQGIEWNTDTMSAVYFSFADCIVATDTKGNILDRFSTDHYLCSMDYYDGNLFITTQFNNGFHLFILNANDFRDYKEIELPDADSIKREDFLRYSGKLQAGIDGVTVAPKIGERDKLKLYISYGIVDTDSKNKISLKEDQLLLEYDYELLLTTGKAKAERILKADLGRVKYYIQTLEYDRDTGNIWCAARKGDEYSLFLIDGKSDNDKLNLIHDNGKSGWDCEQASDGFCSLGHNRYYILIPDYSKRESHSIEKGQGILVYLEQLESITEKQNEKYW